MHIRGTAACAVLATVAAGCSPNADASAQRAAASASEPTTHDAVASTEALPAKSAQPPDPPAVTWPRDLDRVPVAGDRIYSKVRHLWIRPSVTSKAWLGYLSLGDSVRVKDGNAERARVDGPVGKICKTWYAVEPKGFMCTGPRATLDGNDPVVRELKRHRADPTSPWPFRYAESLGTPVYGELPNRYLQRTRELGVEQHLERVAQARALPQDERAAIHPDLALVDLEVPNAGPPPLLDLPPAGRSITHRVARGSTLAFTKEFAWQDRSWLLTWDRGIVPKDKVRMFPDSDFQGVALDEEQRLPMAFFRDKPRPQYRRSDGKFVRTDKAWPRLSRVALTGAEATIGAKRYLETKEGVWCDAQDATVARRRPVPLIVQQKRGLRTWLDISILGGVLVAYEYDTPVYATLISPGRGGIPHPPHPTLDTASTPLGTFAVVGKFLTATMVSGSNSALVHAEVNYTQNFSGPYALHGAYWHDRWGEKMSGGCVNLAPIDARRIFAWTEPRLPEGWHGMRTAEGFGDMTVVSLRR